VSNNWQILALIYCKAGKFSALFCNTGDLKRYDKFMLDPNVLADCQQFSDKAYGHGYDRGDQVPTNHLDYSNAAIKQSNYMTNILPQISQMNCGAWVLTDTQH
jgi:endonuclease G